MTFPLLTGHEYWPEAEKTSKLRSANITVSNLDLMMKPSSLRFFGGEGNLDLMLRINQTAAATTFQGWHTADLSQYLLSKYAKLDCSVKRLRSIIEWQKSRIEYDSYHSAYILGAISEDEFLKEAEPFVREEAALPQSEIVQSIVEINEALESTMSASDYADYLNVDVEAVLAVMPNIPDFLEHSEPPNAEQALALEFQPGKVTF